VGNLAHRPTASEGRWVNAWVSDIRFGGTNSAGFAILSDVTGPGIGHNGDPPLDEAGKPKLQIDRPATTKELERRV
jgi:hypothetical protein